jgi:hypothetical protein
MPMKMTSHITFITPLEYRELAEGIKYTEVYGEIITDDSCVLRDLGDTRVKTSNGLATFPKKLGFLVPYH